MRNEALRAEPLHVTIVGGGFSGASTAIQLIRASKIPLAITLVESQQRAGPGLAYSTQDPDHRLNGPTWGHSIDPLDAGHFTRWCEAREIFKHDPQALRPDGTAFVRRHDYGDYIEDTLRAHAFWPATGSTISILHDRAVSASQRGDTLTVLTEGGRALESKMLIVATGNALPKLQAPLEASLASHPAVIENPLDTAQLLDIPSRARVLLIGSGLTALDVLSTLQRQGHEGQIVAISRRGLRPRPQATLLTPATPASGRENLDRLLAPAPTFLTQSGVAPTLRSWVRALRSRIREVERQGGNWYAAFDELRDSVWQLWPRLPTAQKRRFLKKMRTWYDVHRFRAPPQNDAIVCAAEAAGRIEFRATRLLSVLPLEGKRTLQIRFKGAGGASDREEEFDTIVNCTGLDVASRLASNPFLLSLVKQQWLKPDDCGVAFAVDANCNAVGGDGVTRPTIRLIGPLTAGTFGDPLGAMFIAAQIHRTLPDILNTLDKAAKAPEAGKSPVLNFA